MRRQRDLDRAGHGCDCQAPAGRRADWHDRRLATGTPLGALANAFPRLSRPTYQPGDKETRASAHGHRAIESELPLRPAFHRRLTKRFAKTFRPTLLAIDECRCDRVEVDRRG